MEIFQLQCFIKVVALKSFSDAAYEVSISQSSLSKHISKLEDELGVRLFDRSKRSALLTPAGREFLLHARKLLQDYGEMCNAIRQFTASSHLRIGTVDHMGRVGVTIPIASFLNRFPNGHVSIEMRKSNTLQLMSQLSGKKIDMAFIAHIVSSITGTSNIDSCLLEPYRLHTLVKDEYHTIVNKNHRFAGRDRITWGDLASEKLLLLDNTYSLNGMIRESFRYKRLNLSVAFECDQVDTLLSMVEKDFGITILSSRIAESRYEVVSVSMEEPIARNTVLVVPKELEKNHRNAREFVGYILNYYLNYSN